MAIERPAVHAWVWCRRERHFSLTLASSPAAIRWAGWDATGNAQRVSLAKICAAHEVYYSSTHLAARKFPVRTGDEAYRMSRIEPGEGSF